jgi:hypothetical protein
VSGEPLHSDQGSPATTITAMFAIGPTKSRYEPAWRAGLNYDQGNSDGNSSKPLSSVIEEK